MNLKLKSITTFPKVILSLLFYIFISGVAIIGYEGINWGIKKIKNEKPTKESIFRAIALCDAYITQSELEIQKIEATMKLSAEQNTLIAKALSDSVNVSEYYDKSISTDLLLITSQLDEIAFWKTKRDSLQVLIDSLGD